MKAKELIYLDNLGNALTTTLLVAEVLGKNHEVVFNEVARLLKEEKNEYEAQGETAEDGELWMFYWKRTFTDSQGKIHNIYEITRDGLDILTWSYKDKEDLMKDVFLKEFNKIDPPIFSSQEEITDDKQREAILQIFDSNHEVDRLFKKAALNELNKRARIIHHYQKEDIERAKKQHFLTELEGLIYGEQVD